MKNIYNAPECNMLLLESDEIMIKNSGEIDVNSIDEEKTYNGVSNVGGHLKESSFVQGTKREIIRGESIYIFAAVPATGNLDLFSKLSQYFVIMTFCVLLVTLLVTIVVVRRTVKPMREMAQAARLFASGEFSTG